MRSNRDYRLTIEPLRGILINIAPPIRVSFNIDKSIAGGVNKANVRIYNLEPRKREALAKDEFEQDEDPIPFQFDVGYKGSVESIFKGSVRIGETSREGPNLITTLESQDGGFDFQYAFTSRSVDGGDFIEAIKKDFKEISIGKITKLPNLLRPKVLVGNTLDLVDKQLTEGQKWFVEDGQLNIIKPDEAAFRFIPTVSAQTGLLSTPTREFQKITFTTLMNPTIKIGGLVRLVSVTAPRYNGVYKVETINYTGDNFGAQWEQTVSAIIQPDFVIL